ncbi:MAG: hypothetical protein JNM27_09720 [Leptospirales bacterium]|nr:hypothetical protein [Leptospirales bacterium]
MISKDKKSFGRDRERSRRIVPRCLQLTNGRDDMILRRFFGPGFALILWAHPSLSAEVPKPLMDAAAVRAKWLGRAEQDARAHADAQVYRAVKLGQATEALGRARKMPHAAAAHNRYGIECLDTLRARSIGALHPTDHTLLAEMIREYVFRAFDDGDPRGAGRLRGSR